MTKRERILAAVAGAPVDRTPYSLWYHFRLDPPAGEGMAKAELDFYHRYDPDFLKVMHDIPYEMPADLPLVKTSADWAKLPVLDGTTGNFGEQIATLKAIKQGLGDDGFVVDTVFGIHDYSQKACGKRVLELLEDDPKAAHEGLRTITASLINYVQALTAAGIDGIYYAMTGAASQYMPADLYREHFLAYDQQIMSAAAGAPFNVLHQHGDGIYPDLGLSLTGYQVYCWSDRQEANPSIREIRLKTKHCLMCGVNEVTFGQVSPDDIVREAKEAISEVDGKAFILGPGCAVPTPPNSSDENLKSFRSAVL